MFKPNGMWALVAFVLLGWIVLMGRAFAQQDPLALDLKKAGDEAMIEGRYDEALEAYTRAVAVEDVPALHYNRGRALQALERYAEALTELERFERDADAGLRQRVQQLDALLASARAHVTTLSVSTNVKGAILSVNSTRRMPLPISELRIDAGAYTLEASAPGYQAQTRELTLPGGESVNVNFELVLAETQALLHVESGAVGAEVWMSKERVGNVPLDIAIEPGEHELLLRHPDYRDSITRVVLAPNERRDLRVDMDKRKRIYTRWWFWTGAAVIVAGGVTAVVLATRPEDPARGDLEPGVLVAPLRD